jgi:hypothetical protein
MARPSKMTDKVIEAIEIVINENILFATDEELFVEINDLLSEEQRFTYEAFSKWKGERSQTNNPLFPKFLRLIKKALFKEKKRLLELLAKDDKQWQRYAWILERKFDEWNIKMKSEIDHNINIPTLPEILIKSRNGT